MTVLVKDWLPPSRENWELVQFIFQLFPLVGLIQWAQIFRILPQWHPMGKTSNQSPLNLPGKLAWWTMETPGYVIVLYMLYTLPGLEGIERLPWPNIVLAWMYTIHYIYRSAIYAYFSPSISPINVLLWLGAIAFNVFNGLSIGGWVAGYGPRELKEWTGQWNSVRVEVGMMIWAVALMANMFHDDELREIRRAAARQEKKRQESQQERAKPTDGVQKVYKVPNSGLFRAVLYPHYFTEWIEWCGFWMIGGLAFAPGRTFVINELSTMLPRAVQGRYWYLERFGREKIGSRKAAIPGLL